MGCEWCPYMSAPSSSHLVELLSKVLLKVSSWHLVSLLEYLLGSGLWSNFIYLMLCTLKSQTLVHVTF